MTRLELNTEGRRSSVALVQGATLAWVPDPSTGGEFALLHVDPYSGLWAVRSRLRPGTTVPTHLHSGPVSAVTLSGNWSYPDLEVSCGPGDYLVEGAGAIHELSVTGSEIADIQFTVSGSITYFSDGSPDRIEDWRTVLDEYLAGCNALGLTPTVIGWNVSLSKNG